MNHNIRRAAEKVRATVIMPGMDQEIGLWWSTGGQCCAGARLAHALGGSRIGDYMNGMRAFAQEMGCNEAQLVVMLQQAGAGHSPFGCEQWPAEPEEVWNRLASMEEFPDTAGADLSGIKLDRARMAAASLAGATLKGTKLRKADLRGANLDGANLEKSKLRKADIRWANLSGANLRGADLRQANLSGANLRRADLRQADLSGADLNRANLRGANLDGAKFEGVKPADTALKGMTGSRRLREIPRWIRAVAALAADKLRPARNNHEGTPHNLLTDGTTAD